MGSQRENINSFVCHRQTQGYVAWFSVVCMVQRYKQALHLAYSLVCVCFVSHLLVYIFARRLTCQPSSVDYAACVFFTCLDYSLIMDTPSQDPFSQDSFSSNSHHEFDMPFRSSGSSGPPMSEGTWALGMRLYCQAWDAYREAGTPFGSSDDAMIIWYTFRVDEDFDLRVVCPN